MVISPPIFDPHSQLVELQSIMAVLTPAIAAMAPIFALMEIVQAIIDFVKAVATLNPAQIAAALADFIEATEKLLGIVPQVSLPLMLIGLITIAIDMVIALIDFLTELAIHQQQIEYMKQYAIDQDLPDLLASAVCLETNLDTQLAYFNNGIGAVAGFMAIIELLGSIIGLDLSIDMSVDEDDPIEDTIDRLTEIRDTLIGIRELIPV